MSAIIDEDGILLEEDGSNEFAPGNGAKLYATSDGWKAKGAKDGRELRLGQIHPEYARMWMDEAHLKASASISTGKQTVANSSQQYGMYSYPTPLPPATAGDELYHGFQLAAGTYNFTVLGVTNTNYGIATYYVDGGSIGTLDWYAAPAFNVRKTISSVVISSGGWHELKIEITGKHVSSSAYGYLTTCMTFKKP